MAVNCIALYCIAFFILYLCHCDRCIQVQKQQRISMQFSTFAFPVCVPKNILIFSDLDILLLLVSESIRGGEAFRALFPC